VPLANLSPPSHPPPPPAAAWGTREQRGQGGADRRNNRSRSSPASPRAMHSKTCSPTAGGAAERHPATGAFQRPFVTSWESLRKTRA